ncbi:peptidoglycan-binding domain-containing protein [Mesorhizobium xinjiangense]|uniref:peptidoglycan-binding domain-containing protein n=1 Tax=Mesorhizobium xinjiangense TaxID=2678685 RepID=UPI0012EDF76C|nr:peptidoglycan-binding protein [Mesorhizobium xinjiangense]
MRNSARSRRPSREASGLTSQALTIAGHAIARNPLIVGSTTGFLIILFYVSANAMWYQPHRHMGAFLSTRAAPPRPIIERPAEPAVPPRAAPAPEPRPEAMAPQGVSTESVASVSRPQPIEETAAQGRVATVQRQLKALGLYPGEVDGLIGPQTHKAVEDYQKGAGLEVTGTIDEALVAQLSKGTPTAIADDPVPTPAPRVAALEQADERAETASVVPDRTVVKVQAGLRSFGNDGIEIDGVVGDRTAVAIREFQSLFGLPVTGKVDADLLSKMDEIGLIDG